jgi:hypothetical protein
MSPPTQMPSFSSIMEGYHPEFHTEMHRSSSPHATCVDCTEEEEESVPDPQIHDSGPIDDSDDEAPAEDPKPGTFQALRFMEAYRKGLNGNQAAWANKKYRGHRIIPDSILRDLENANIH